MTMPTLNPKNYTIEMTKTFATASNRYGTEEYEILQKICEKHPNYKPVIKTTKRKSTDNFKGLTYNFMEKYIKSHDNAETNLADFMLLRGKSEEAEALEAESASYAEIKEWFLATYPAFAAFQTKREALLNKSKEANSEEKKTA